MDQSSILYTRHYVNIVSVLFFTRGATVQQNHGFWDWLVFWMKCGMKRTNDNPHGQVRFQTEPPVHCGSTTITGETLLKIARLLSR